ncbi:MAG: glycosyltransferase family 4 protein [bacterium]|nr:glycosyltransferase family 4 protein [bacterium]
MRILYLVPRFPMPSETFVSHEVVGVGERGHDVMTAAFGGPSAAELEQLVPAARELARGTRYVTKARLAAAPFTTPLNTLGASRAVRTLNARLAGESTHRTNAWARLARAAAVARIVRREGIEHVHAHWPQAAQVAALVHAWTGVPYSISVHAHEVVHDHGHFPAVFETLAFAAFCNRAAMEALLGRLGPHARGRSHLVYHGVDLDLFAATPPPDVRAGLRVVSAGRMTPTKGMPRLVRGVRAAVDAGVDVSLVLVGDGGQRDELARLARELSIPGRVELRGWVRQDEMPAILADAHVFALLPDDRGDDGLPNVVLEAAAAGRPVVLSAIPAAKEAVEPGVNGWIVPVEDSGESFARVLAEVGRDPAQLAALGAGARTHVERHYDRRMHLDRLARLFAS